MLTPGEVDEFFGVVRGLVDKGKSIIFITHKLREVLAVADRITVLRGGRAVGTADPATATEQDLANLMVGRDVVFTVDKRPPTPANPCCASTDLTVTDDRGVTLTVCPGSTSRSGPARSSASPASRATGSASWSRPSPACAPQRAAPSACSATSTPPMPALAPSPTSAWATSPRTATATAWSVRSPSSHVVLNRDH